MNVWVVLMKDHSLKMLPVFLIVVSCINIYDTEYFHEDSRIGFQVGFFLWLPVLTGSLCLIPWALCVGSRLGIVPRSLCTSLQANLCEMARVCVCFSSLSVLYFVEACLCPRKSSMSLCIAWYHSLLLTYTQTHGKALAANLTHTKVRVVRRQAHSHSKALACAGNVLFCIL